MSDETSRHGDIAGRRLTVLPDDAAAALRGRLGLSRDAELRIAYVPGPGDALGTLGYWRDGRHDPRVPVFTYSAMYYELLEKLGATGFVLTRHPGSDPHTIARDTPPDSRVTFVQHLKGSMGGVAGYWRREVKYARGLIRHLARFDPHVVVVATDVPWFLWPLLGRNRVCLLSAHNTFWKMGEPPAKARTRLKLAVTGLAMRGLSGAVCTSGECARQIKMLSKDTVPTWTEIPQQKRLFSTDRAHDTARHICFLGRIVASKGMVMLIDAFGAVARTRPDMTLTFAGSGPAEKDLAARIAQDGDDRVRFVGRLDADHVHKLLAESDLLACPTRSDFAEGLGLVVAEAAAHGVPSVVSTMVPARDLFSTACAVFPADDTAALTGILDTLASDAQAYQALCQGTIENRDMMMDRSRSWGSQLFAAMMGAR